MTLSAIEAAYAQDADGAGEDTAVEAVLPDVVVSTEQAKPKQRKYPTAKVAKKRPASATASTPQSVETAPETATEVVVPAADAVPEVATSGALIKDRQGLLDLSGSGAVVTGEELYTSHVFTTNEALRKVPGVVVRDEEGFGIRPNIGIRGMNPTRSTKTLLLEDGIFLTYAPYGDNASYFHPSSDRFESIEVIKGMDQLLYGPQTISGAINYITPNPPKTPAGFAALTGGSRDYINGQFNYGGWSGPFGGLVDYVYKEGDGARDNTHHQIQDVSVKGIAQVSSESAFIAKFNYFNEDSQVTYSGITDAEARSFGIRYNPFKNDEFNTERFAGSLTNNWDMNQNVSVATKLYFSQFDRDWWRQASTTTDSQCNPSVPTFLADRAAGVAIDVDDCNSRQGRLRSYYARGLEQRWTFDYPVTETIANTLKTGFRLHSEDQQRLQVNATSPRGTSGPVSENNEREATAISLFAHNKLSFGAFSITPAVRYEDIDYTRTNKPTATSSATTRGTAEFQEFIPGVSVGFEPAKNVLFFAGIHEGFAPPGVADVISGGGGSVDTNPEKSTNIEIGFKTSPLIGLLLDGTYFRNDFDNLIAVGSIAGGGLSNVAQGEALFEGFELGGRVDSNKWTGANWNVYGQLAWTYLWQAEQSSAFRDAVTGAIVAGSLAGNRQPYAPEHTITARIGYGLRNFDAHVEIVYIDEQFADFQNFNSAAEATGSTGGILNSLNGRFGKIDDYVIFNAGVTYTYEPTNTDIFLAVKNVFDEEYIADRTRGILPGAPRLFHVGLKQNF
ncbi:MAG: TonB-dependent receptor domain-containing protein [Hyphomicrobium sp.]